MTGNEGPPTAPSEDAVSEHGHALAIPEHAHALAIPEPPRQVAILDNGHAVAVADPPEAPPVAPEQLAAEEPAAEELAAVEAAAEELAAVEAAAEEPAAEEAVAVEAAAEKPAPEEPAAEEAVAEEPASTLQPKVAGPRTVGFDRSVEERKQRAEQHWQHVVASRESGETLNGTVTTAVKGGLLVDVGGVRGFLPASQTRLEPGASLESLVKTKVPLRVIDVDEKRRRVVVSQRRALDDLRRAKRTELLRSLRVGQRHDGVVVRLAPFGAFVDIGSGIEGLVPMSELAFDRVDRVEDVLKIGELVPVTIHRIEEGGRKIGLSRKNALPDPLRDHAALLRPGTVIEGKVVAKDPRLQVEIAPGLVGSVRESDADPAQYEIGEAIEVSVRYVDRRNRRVVLTTMHGAETVVASSSGFAPLGVELLAKGRR